MCNLLGIEFGVTQDARIEKKYKCREVSVEEPRACLAKLGAAPKMASLRVTRRVRVAGFTKPRRCRFYARTHMPIDTTSFQAASGANLDSRAHWSFVPQFCTLH